MNALELLTGEKISVKYDKLIIATGSAQVIPTCIEGLDYLKNVTD